MVVVEYEMLNMCRKKKKIPEVHTSKTFLNAFQSRNRIMES